MAKSNAGLVSYCEKALSEKWYYGWGAYGQKATSALVDSLVSQYPAMNTQWKSYMLKAVTAGTKLCDCYGLVKGYLFTDGTGTMKYSAAYDINSATAYSRAKEKGPLSTMPETPGLILHMDGHVGVYAGNGRFIECAGGGVGMRAGRIENKKIASGSPFAHWFKDMNIDYSAPVAQPVSTAPIVIAAPEAPKISVTELPIVIGSKEVSVRGILHEGFNYVNLREFASAVGLTVESDPYENVPIVSQDVSIGGGAGADEDGY
jgi:hypothetical protein